ncbi:DUF2975 domain-containing protein [Arcanobacterium haemolyticum]|nr:DUF2975 domain-containing protein [Arcanobacterium haemolyticum]
MATLSRWGLLASFTFFLLALLLGQILVPVIADDVADSLPEVRHLVGPYSALGIATLACFQIATIAMGLVFARNNKDTFFSSATRRRISTSGLTCMIGFLIPAGTALHLLATVHAGGPAVVLGLGATFVAAAGFGCLRFIALRAFDSARADYEELGGVI